MFTLWYEKKEYVLDNDVTKLSKDVTEEEVVAYNKHYNEPTKVAYLMLAVMASELQKRFENRGA